MELMSEIPGGSVDMVLCDLPYGTTRNKWDSVIPLHSLWSHYRRVCKPGAALVFTAAQPFTTILGASNLAWLRYAWVWRKNNATGHLNAKRMPMKDTEDVLVFYDKAPVYHPQGLAPYGKMGRRGGNGECYGKSGTSNMQEFTGYPRTCLDIPYDAPAERGAHPTQKPVQLMEYMVRTYTDEGAVVLDNTMGSGTTGVACVRTGRRFVGIEKDSQYFETAKARLESA